MTSLSLLLPISLSLSTDAFAASLARGASLRSARFLSAVKNGLVFGSIEGLMCFSGWALAGSFSSFLTAVDHWVALLLLGLIGGHMLREGLSEKDEEDEVKTMPLGLLLLTAVGTSVDSAAIGIAFAFVGTGAIAALMVGLMSFLASSVGFYIGPKIGSKFGKRAECAGGAVLIIIGVSIFVQHMWFT